jgi:hypothetical protein
MDPVTILAALMPFAVDLGKSLISRYIAPENFKPASVTEWVTMQEMQLKLFEAMNGAGGANPSYPWVEAVVRLQRPLVAALALGTWVYSHAAGMPSDAVNNFAGAVGFYLFGDRTLFYAKKAVSK